MPERRRTAQASPRSFGSFPVTTKPFSPQQWATVDLMNGFGLQITDDSTSIEAAHETWEQIKDAVRDGWDRIVGNR